jgi:hypothetical protein
MSEEVARLLRRVLRDPKARSSLLDAALEERDDLDGA